MDRECGQHRAFGGAPGPLRIIVVDSRIPEPADVTVVERKGWGHPDTLADHLAECLSQAYSRLTLREFGAVLHHNFDKLALLGGASEVRYGAGRITSPVRVLVNGRAARTCGGRQIPVDELIIDTTREFFARRLPELDGNLRIELNVTSNPSPGAVVTGTGPPDRSLWFAPRCLDDLRERRVRLSNDTSLGTGWAPENHLEGFARELVDWLSAPEGLAAEHPWCGSDVKLMGYGAGGDLDLVLCVPQMCGYVPSRAAYAENKERLLAECHRLAAERLGGAPVRFRVNVRDIPGRDELYLTYTGSSIESGDEGVVGRGNRVTGLITPLRPNRRVCRRSGRHASTPSGISRHSRRVMMTDPGELVTALRRTLGMHWAFDSAGNHLCIRHQARGASSYRPRRRPVNWDEMLAILAAAFAEHGIAQAPPLPLRWNRETDFTISAIQALDPHLKQCRSHTYRQGYLPQPVVRFTGQRNTSGHLADGFLTAFVNVSCVLPIDGPAQHAQILDTWLTALSRLGLHARHVEIHGATTPWQRREVQGITLRIRHSGLEIGDVVILWNADSPSFMATDLGSGLERIRWAITRRAWPFVVYGSLADRADPVVLDIIRAATLIAGSGVSPSDRGPGNALRRLARSIPESTAALGLSVAVRSAYAYWSLTSQLQLPWPEVCQMLDKEASHAYL